MLRGRAHDAELAVLEFLPPVELDHVRDPLLLEPALETEGHQEDRVAFGGEPLDGAEVEMIEVVVRQEDHVDGRKVLESEAGGLQSTSQQLGSSLGGPGAVPGRGHGGQHPLLEGRDAPVADARLDHGGAYGLARGPQWGSVSRLTPSSCRSTVACPIHVTVGSEPLARRAAPSLASRGTSIVLALAQARFQMKAKRAAPDGRSKAGLVLRKPPST